MSNQNDIILVNENDEPVGISDKRRTHQQGLLHRAFSVFIYRKINNNFEILLQQRHQDKYHCGGLWTNTCCSHPLPSETITQAGERRLKQEMGFSTCLEKIGVFHYTAHLDNDLIENEIDHVLIGQCDPVEIIYNKEEVASYRWVTTHALKNELETTPESFTPWFKEAFSFVEKGALK